MNDDAAKGQQKLGRGLSALFGEEQEDYANLDAARQGKMVPIEQLSANPFQPRRSFDEEELKSLAESIEAHGVLQPILVRRDPEDPNSFQIVAGERRWRAAQLARQHSVPVSIRKITDSDALEIAIVENVQRQDLNPVEEARGYRRLIDEFTHRQEDLAKTVGKSRSHIANTLRLLNLPDEIQEMLTHRELTAGHARALLNTEHPIDLAKDVVKNGLSVRQTERLAQGPASRPKAAQKPSKDADTMALERDMSELLGLKVTVTFRENGGQLTIHYDSLEQLDDVLGRLRSR